MSNKNIVIIGGTACGPKAAVRARRCDPQARITIIERYQGISTATCGFPYYISGVIPSQDSLQVRGPDYFKQVMDIDIFLHTRAEKIDRTSHTIDTINLQNGKQLKVEYDKLVLATGSSPVVPDIAGKQLRGIFTLSNIQDTSAIKSYMTARNVNKIVIIGGGFIGLEMAESFAALGAEVTIVEALEWIMPAFLDFEMAALLEKHIRSKGINVLCSERVNSLQGKEDNSVSSVITDKRSIESQLVLLAVGTRPNVQLARDSGLDIGSRGGISVNEQLQTSDPDIYAGGDCVENLHRITGRKVLVPLGSTANKHGRIIGTNITGGNDTFPGVLGTGIAKVFDFNIGRVGLTEKEAAASGYDVVTCLVEGNEHARYYPGSKVFMVKLIVDKSNRKLLGAQLAGPGNVSKRLDVLVTALSFGASVDDIASLDLAYAPPYNGAIDPVHHAANTVRNKLDGLARGVSPMEVKSRLDNKDDFTLLDVRSVMEWRNQHIEAKQEKLIPLDKLREKLDELSMDSDIIIYCHTSYRAYLAQRILDGAGFKNTKFMDGSIAAWPYETGPG